MAVSKSTSSLPSHCFNGDIRPSLVPSRATPQKWTILEETSDLSKPHQTILNGQSLKDEFSMEYEQKLKDVRELLKSEELENQIESLMLVDAIQRLGVDYHFQEEIEAVLRRHYMEATTSFDGYSLHDLSLFFRLLREHGFFIPAAQEFKQARNQPLKWYTWSMASLSDPSMSEQRLELTKSITFIYIIDDIFDLYGTPEELTVFTRAVHMWDSKAIHMLPKSWKMCYKALLDTTNDIGYKIYKKHGYNPIDSLKSTWASLCDAFLVEAKWFASGHLPTSNEYLENGKVSSGAHVVLIHLFYLLGINKRTGGAVQLDDISELISSVAAILRLWDDFGSAKDEQQDGNDGSYIECYVRENPGLAVEIARKRVVDIISREWKNLNKECLRLNQNSSNSSFTKASLNLARMVPLMYSYDDNQQLPVLQEFIKSTLFDDTFLVHHPST
ncbi:unnamed protein product [Fraxinus pennsylvanica]|uniref:Uncharacterized protein n=1 Tax=Fraxinus pennsylvanica TaxID=56036 RepID=A0AAD1YS44_9LAMI|nr:unnamed protein product [Fraxinus pennsylvanica]